MPDALRPPTGELPTFGLDDDGRHFWWEHDCTVTWTTAPGDVTVHRAGPQILPLDPERGWTVTSTDPLTVTPSILCTGCGTHGFITNGAWIGV